MSELEPGAAGLRRMKVVATSMFAGAAVLYVVARSQHADPAVWGYVEAFAEAAMVGALADWFAVTALFRHPLGIPIPHTAIIPRRKDQIARSLGTFVEENFLSHEVIGERLQHAHIGDRVGHWLAEPTNAARAADAVTDVVHQAVRVLDDREVRAALERAIEARIDDTQLSPLAGRVVEIAIENGHHKQVFDAALKGARRFLADNKEVLRVRVEQETPWWLPRTIDRRLFAKLYEGTERFLAEVEANPNHELRVAAERHLAQFAERLGTDPELRARGEQLKSELLTHPEARDWIGSLWDEVKAKLLDETSRKDSEFHARVAATLARLGARVRDDPELQARVDRGVERLAGYVIDNYRQEVTHLIESTIARWDPAATSRRIELQVGRDLQFIRINGTLVGGLAGLLIYTMSEIVF